VEGTPGIDLETASIQRAAFEITGDIGTNSSPRDGRLHPILMCRLHQRRIIKASCFDVVRLWMSWR
jgi:hypothetical protein